MKETATIVYDWLKPEHQALRAAINISNSFPTQSLVECLLAFVPYSHRYDKADSAATRLGSIRSHLDDIDSYLAWYYRQYSQEFSWTSSILMSVAASFHWLPRCYAPSEYPCQLLGPFNMMKRGSIVVLGSFAACA